MDFFQVFLKNPVSEKIFCYTLNPPEAVKIEPDESCYFVSAPAEAAKLEAGEYYVTQVRKEDLKNSELLDLAIELQKEALWNRLKLENVLYLRRLFEDNSPVTQLWRPLIIKV